MNPISVAISRTAACTAAVLGLCATTASGAFSSATYIPCESAEGLGSFRAEVGYSYSGGTVATVSVALSNNTDPSLGGYITALALNPHGTAGGLGFASATSAAFTSISPPISAPPYGSFAAGAGLSGEFLGTGDPSFGIAVGSTEVFTFTLTGSASALAALDAETVFASSTGYSMIVRFRGGAVDDWSDKVVGCALPAPGALALLGAMGLVPKRRRRV